MRNEVTIISHARDCFIELIHRDSDPGSWIVRRWEKSMLFKRLVSSHWFNDATQAGEFAKKMKREHDESV